MYESFLYFIWQQQYFNKEKLSTTSGIPINIIFPGYLNHNSGPDFNDGEIIIDRINWAGSVEMHVKSSDWLLHEHQKNKAYDNVILHVVWEYDTPVFRTDGSEIPTLELKGKVNPALVVDCNDLVNSIDNIPCANQLPEIDPHIKLSMMDRVLVQRLERKALEVLHMYEKSNHNWEECAYQLLCKNLGFKINAQPFEQLAKALPINTLRKHSNSQFQIEALLFGQAGFLNKLELDYQQELDDEYRFLAHKYHLNNKVINKEEWKFARLRPANFPTVRLAQLSLIIKNTTNLFTSLIEVKKYSDVERLLKIDMTNFWQKHYLFGESTERDVASIGKSSIENIIINTIAPLMVAFSKNIDNDELVERSIALLTSIPSEKNKITRKWIEVGEKSISAFDSQAKIELYNNFCLKKKCLQCEIGVHCLKITTVQQI